ncbi:Cortactin-binding protein 2 [Liparis tanakae]|uniref:Cortactin-binding protein 2 n=1 Tax=Liparis tanakae TaxID=230148 RepID=A0A4Z2ES32_9TELE|nr:Cortactin-binding protein 2 [Liparis tanakae]
MCSWLAQLWNAVVVPRVEEAVIRRLTAKRCSSSSSSSSSSPTLRSLSAGQQAVVKAALGILVTQAVLQGCPLPRHEVDRYLLEFRGGAFPLSAIGSYKGSGGGGGARKGRDGGKLRRSNTSPRKKGGPALGWSAGSFREGKKPLCPSGSLSSSDVSFIANGNAQSVSKTTTLERVSERIAVHSREALSGFSDGDADLIRELQTLSGSRSEPDVSKKQWSEV